MPLREQPELNGTRQKDSPPFPRTKPPRLGGQSSRGTNGEPGPSPQRNTLLAEIAHQLSQPVTALYGILELALQKPLDAAEYRESLRAALQRADHLVWLVRSLAELGKADDPAPLPQIIELNPLVAELAEDMGLLAAEGGATLLVECQGTPSVAVDSLQLRQALFNVINHILRHSSPGATVRVLLSAGDSSNVCLTISSDSLPAAPQEMAHWLDPVYSLRMSGATSKKEYLQLAVARRIIEAAGGRIRIEEENRLGSGFTICLPLAED